MQLLSRIIQSQCHQTDLVVEMYLFCPLEQLVFCDVAGQLAYQNLQKRRNERDILGNICGFKVLYICLKHTVELRKRLASSDILTGDELKEEPTHSSVFKSVPV